MRRHDHLSTYLILCLIVIVASITSSGITWYCLRSPDASTKSISAAPAESYWEPGYQNRVLKPNGRYEYAAKILAERDGVLIFETYDSVDNTFTKQTVSMPYQIEPDGQSIHSYTAEQKGIK